MLTKNNHSKKIEQIFPVILFLILSVLVIFFINNSKSDSKNDSDAEMIQVLPTVALAEELCKSEDLENALTTISPEIPTYEELISIETECNSDDYPGEVIRLNIKEAYSYLTFALEKDIPILGWNNLITTDVTEGETFKTQISANKPGKTLQILISSIDVTSEGETSITYYIYDE
ncbi:hypothetical protein KC675_00445 [Candidatus Dojkabacteria bacterium]|uniref:Uncharacterized protein n=1 Tax=Candidatus Dojkabacteria bacterium TaxID=2099670 RepID=A0A955I6Y5_9BACT|nr:hypothetical protein [Candidatus Dojkabacteria bacterium]